MTAGLSRHVPWWTKLGLKLVLARMPLSYNSWRSLGIFKLGAMLDADSAMHARLGRRAARCSNSGPATRWRPPCSRAFMARHAPGSWIGTNTLRLASAATVRSPNVSTRTDRPDALSSLR
jgi:hypothetical protein